MRLKQIKLSGFKSFVDVTTVPFPKQMTAIVGPNGCGKSNIIDAVRWVLGESSAKNLRGDAMTDVIFNGSSARKPVGQASVELVFDNSDGSLQGSMADRTEISVRRLVTRESVNSYFLNGTKCRRRDITDIFLGTGLGPRSYAIIEQGTISRLIESKPQELRVFIEEAAGISKYKERRRETENRIRATRDNLERLTDVRAELGVQIEKLRKQSHAAKLFKDLKAKERRLKAEIAALRWQQYHQKSVHYKSQVTELELQQEALITEQRQKELTLIDARSQLEQGNDELAKHQHRLYQVNTDITRLEQDIKYSKERQQSLNEQLHKIAEQMQELSEHLALENEKSAELELSNETLLPELEEVEEQLEQAQEQLEEVHSGQRNWQIHWDEFTRDSAQFAQQTQVTQTKIQSCNDLMARTELQISQLKQTLEDTNVEQLSEQRAIYQAQLEQLNEDLERVQQEHHTAQQHYQQSQSALESYKQQLTQANLELQNKQARLNALNEITNQQSDWQQVQEKWLIQNNTTKLGSLHQMLTVEPKWQLAVEQILASWLQADVIESLPEKMSLSTSLIVTQSSKNSSSDSSLNVKGSLASQVSGFNPFVTKLNTVFTASDLDQAKAKLAELNEGESVICPDGTWLGRHNSGGDYWLQKGSFSESSGMLARSQEISELNELVDELEQSYSQCQVDNQQAVAQLAQTKQQFETVDSNLNQLQRQIAEVKSEVSLCDVQLNQSQKLREENLNALAHLESSLADEVEQYQELLEQQLSLEESHHHDSDKRDQLQQQRDDLQSQQQSYQNKVQSLTQMRHQLALNVANAKTQLQNLNNSITRAREQITQLGKQKESLVNEQQAKNEPELANEQLQELLEQRSEIEHNQQLVQAQVAEVDEKIRLFEQGSDAVVNQVQKLQEQVGQAKLDSETNLVRANTALEQLAEMQQQLEAVLAEIPDNANEDVWQGQLDKVSKNINRLGAINLAAIEEFESQSERKSYLDQQNDDLESALETLGGAIAKIDRESRAKFKTTFEQVNSDLQMLFPKVFGGGSAYLELTGDDLLDTGVTIMARPPGKKNSTIHLLSGGEKALTALSLVFAIFRLNPAPFCMLDEVDAPLDDANVNRFCNLVQEMSQTVQFIYISHNKIAMEMASHLTGVTMFEPGCSRMVAVDIDEAVAMAEAS